MAPHSPDEQEDVSVEISGSLHRGNKFRSAVGKPLALNWTIAAAAMEEAQIIRRDREKREVTQLITVSDEHRLVISVWGTGGLGKTTLVKSVYQSRDLSGMFQKRAWISVLHPFNPNEIFRSLAMQLHMDSSSAKREVTDFSFLGGGIQKKKLEMMGTEELIQESIRLLKGHKYLIILDDVLSTAEWDLILPVLPKENKASQIILTTREEIVVTCHCSEYKLKPLEDEPALDLLEKKVFKDQSKKVHLNPDMMKEAKLIIKKCGGLPLAIATIGGFLATRPKTALEWRNLNDHISSEVDNNLRLEKIKTILTSS